MYQIKISTHQMCEVVQCFSSAQDMYNLINIAREMYKLMKPMNLQNVPILPSIHSVQDEKCPFHKNCYRIAKTCKNVHMHVQHTEKHVGVLQTADFFQVGQRIPRQIIWTYLSLSASTLKMTELTLKTIQSKFYGQFKPNRETNIDKIMLPLPTFCGNKWIDTQLILGLFSRGLKSQQFSRMWTHGLRQFRQRFGNKKKDRRKG